MKTKKIKVCYGLAVVLLPIFLNSSATAEEIVLQQKKIPYDKCLKIIETSEHKLSIEPRIKNSSDQRLVAVFTLVDGTLKITCDREEGNVTISTNTN